MAWAEALGSTQVVTGDGKIDFDTGSHTQAAFTYYQDHGVQAVEAGYYKLSYSVRPPPGQTSTVPLHPEDNPSFILNLNGSPLETSRVYRPTLNVNVALVLALRTLIDGATVEYSGYQYLAAGAIVSLQASGNPAGTTTSLAASLRIERLS